jgi:hypothetical protein
MQNIIQTCEPRKDILAGTFNPEIFTASLSEVIQFYQSDRQAIHPIYTDAKQFFTEGTYATDGFKMVLNEVFARLAGDATAPAIHRLETAFGGGKTHTLIACAHLAYKGKALASLTSDMLEPRWLPEPGEVKVVGIAGNEIPVHKPRGSKLIPYTLWGEMALQIGGEALYREVEDEATGFAAPGTNYLETLFGGRKVLLMIDELAQYSARLSAARPDGSRQLAAFLMTLHGYARSNPNISIVLTLASATDAFAVQTGELAELLNRVTGQDMNPDEALEIGQKAVREVANVVSRDATSVVPVQAAEISRVLSRRLFNRIDSLAARQTAEHYMEMYRKNSSLLPDEATREDFADRLASHYPFHPTFIDFLNNKLATYENFQGTRGVLRILALAVRRLWRQEAKIPMIHTCHLDLRNARTVNEVIGRSGSSDLLSVLNADVGGADTDGLTGGRSNAELVDLKNPHPEGWPLYEYTWKTVFLHSLVGREQGLGSSIFGLTTQDALFEVSFPGLTPPQVNEALKEISNSAFYLRFNQGRYYASLDPSVNIALAKLRRSLSGEAVNDLLAATARKVIRSDVSKFIIVPDVAAPEHIPDKQGRPCIALVSLEAETISVSSFITTAGPNRPRIEQNLVFLLVPDTVDASTPASQQELQFADTPSAAAGRLNRLKDLARTVLAMRELKKNPQNHGISPQKLDAADFKGRHEERENALISAVTETYRNLWYPSANGQIVCKEIRTSGGESGTPVIEQIRRTLYDDGELVTADHTTRSALTNLKKLFFDRHDVAEISRLRENFRQIRSWPILESPDLFNTLIREGVKSGMWCLFSMGNTESTLPDEFYSADTKSVPLDIDLGKGYSLVTPEGAKKRGWQDPGGPDPKHVQDYVRSVMQETPASTVGHIREKTEEKFGDLPGKDIVDAISRLLRDSRIYAYKKDPAPGQPPELIHGDKAALYVPDAEDRIVTPAKAAEQGWAKPEDNTIRVSGKDGAQKILPLLRRLGSIYQQGGKSRIDLLDVSSMELPNGGTLRVVIENAPPGSVSDLGELFETIDSLVSSRDQAECYLEIRHPETDCSFTRELKKNSK